MNSYYTNFALVLGAFTISVAFYLSSSASAADCVYEGGAYSVGAVVCVPNSSTSITCKGDEWVPNGADVDCKPGSCWRCGKVFSEGTRYSREGETDETCVEGKWVPN